MSKASFKTDVLRSPFFVVLDRHGFVAPMSQESSRPRTKVFARALRWDFLDEAASAAARCDHGVLLMVLSIREVPHA
jgi:hypothetical protein